MNDEQRLKFRACLLSQVPADGSSVSNMSLQARLRQAIRPEEIEDNDYWDLRQPLIDEGIIAVGRGYGGTVRLSNPKLENEAEPHLEEPVTGELDLYEPFYASMSSFAKAEGLDNYVVVKTAMQGRRSTGGKWTRPDLVIVAVRTFEFIPGKQLEVMSFEIKPYLSYALEGVFEALAHSAFAHRSYLAVHAQKIETQSPNQDFERVSSECARHGVGLYTFTDAGDFTTFELQQEALRRNPDPSKVNTFLATQLDSETKNRVRAMAR